MYQSQSTYSLSDLHVLYSFGSAGYCYSYQSRNEDHKFCKYCTKYPVSTHIWDPTGGHMGKIMGPLWATQRGPTWGMIMGFHWDPSGISLGTHMGPRSFPSKSHTNSHMGPSWVCPCISHIYIFIYICIIYKFILLMLFLFIV